MPAVVARGMPPSGAPRYPVPCRCGRHVWGRWGREEWFNATWTDTTVAKNQDMACMSTVLPPRWDDVREEARAMRTLIVELQADLATLLAQPHD